MKNIERFRLWVSNITNEYAHQIIREYSLVGSKKKVSAEVCQTIDKKSNWLTGNLVNMCLYMVGEVERVPNATLMWYRTEFPKLEGIFK